MPESGKNQDRSEKAKYWLAFSRIQKIGPANFHRLINYFRDLKTAWDAHLPEYQNAGLEEDLAQEIIIAKSQINPDAEWERMAQEDVRVVLLDEDEYPKLLKEIYHPPPLLYYRGSLECLNQFCIAVVGTRRFSAYGKQAAEEMAADLARQGITIVSGLAFGIDAIAHHACLTAQGLTAAVLGSGADWQNIFPSANRYLAKRIADEGGAIISEFPLGTFPAKFTFPMRNRIISGLSLGTLVVEAPESSGALITAKYALEQNRQVFAVPGNIFSQSSIGANELIKQGAKMVTSAKDILEELNLQEATQFIASQKLIPDNPEEELVIKFLSKEPTHIDKIANSCKLKINALSGLLMMMEMKGLIKDLGGKNYVRAR